MASLPASILLIGAALMIVCGLFGSVWMAFRFLGTYLVEKHQLRPSRINAVAKLLAAISFYLCYINMALYAPQTSPQAVVSIWSRSIWPLLVVTLFCSWYIAPGIETLRRPPDTERRPSWYRGPNRPDWLRQVRSKPVQRFSMSLLLIWISSFCVLLGLGQMWTGQRRTQSRARHASNIAATRRIESLGGLIQQGGYVSLANTEVKDDDLRVIADFNQLVSLNLGFTAITNDGLRYLGSSRSLNQLTLSGTHVDDRGLEQLGYITGLRVLLLRSTRITGTGLADFRKHQPAQLHLLDLSLCPLSPPGLRAIAGMNCRLLRIDGRVVTAANLATLQELQVDTLEIGDVRGDQATLQQLQQGRPDLRIVSYDPSTQKRRRAE